MKTVLIIGDSLVRGVGGTNFRGWAHIVADTFPDQQFEILGVDGDTAERVHGRLPAKAYDLVILHVGTNDSSHRTFKDARESPPERFAKYLARIHERFRPPSTARLLIVGLFGVDETRANPVGTDKRYTKAAIEEYDAILARFARRHAIEFVALPRPIKLKWLEDGLHPNDVGHGWIASHVVKALRRRFGFIARPLGDVVVEA